MASSVISLKTDSRQVAEFIEGWTRNEKKVMRSAYSKAASVIKKATLKKVRTMTTSKGSKVNVTTLIKGVRQSNWKNAKGSSVYIRSPRDPYYKLLFFEGGTRDRVKGHRRGRIKASWAFKDSVNSTQKAVGEMFEAAFRQAYEKIEKQASRQ